MASVSIHSCDIRKPVVVVHEGAHVWIELDGLTVWHMPKLPRALEAAHAIALAFNMMAFPSGSEQVEDKAWEAA